MSTVTGTLTDTRTGLRAVRIPVKFVARNEAAVIIGAGGVFTPDRIVQTNDVGLFSAVLPMGTYDIEVSGKDVYRIVVPDDDDAYDFVDLLDPESPVTQSVDNPIAVLGLVISENETTLAADRTASSTLRMAALYSPADSSRVLYRWDNSSALAHNGTTVINPTGNVGNGRWRLISLPSGGGSGGFDRVTTIAAMKAIVSSASNKIIFVTEETDPNHGKVFNYKHGDATAAVDYQIIAPDDGGGRFFRLL